MDHTISVLSRCPLFENKTERETETLIADLQAKTVRFGENEIIFSAIQNATHMGIVLSGTVDVQKFFPTGKVILIERKRQGDLLAESSLFSKLDYYPDTFFARDPTEVLLLSRQTLLTLFARDDDILQNFLTHLSNTTLSLRHKIGILSLDSIREKIAGYLLHAYRETGNTIVSLPFSKREWAEYMDVSRTSLSRELRSLEQSGLIAFDKRQIEIIDRKGLERVLSL